MTKKLERHGLPFWASHVFLYIGSKGNFSFFISIKYMNPYISIDIWNEVIYNSCNGLFLNRQYFHKKAGKLILSAVFCEKIFAFVQKGTVPYAI